MFHGLCRMRRNFRACRLFIFLFLSTLVSSGCVSFKPIDEAVITHFTLNTLPAPIKKQVKSQLVLLVNTPKASAIYEGTKMAYVPSPHVLAYFAHNAWAEPPAQMLEPLMIKTLQDTGRFRSVISSAASGHYDLVLYTQLVTLQQVFLQKPSQIHIVLRAQLCNAGDNRVIASKEFYVTEATEEESPRGGVLAANRAVAKILQDLREFCLGASEHL